MTSCTQFYHETSYVTTKVICSQRNVRGRKRAKENYKKTNNSAIRSAIAANEEHSWQIATKQLQQIRRSAVF